MWFSRFWLSAVGGGRWLISRIGQEVSPGVYIVEGRGSGGEDVGLLVTRIALQVEIKKSNIWEFQIFPSKIATPVQSENEEPAAGVEENEGSNHQEEENAEPDVL